MEEKSTEVQGDYINRDKKEVKGDYYEGGEHHHDHHHHPEPKSDKILTSLPKNDLFIGREDELKDIKKALQDDGALLLLNGTGGIGKTALAIEYLNRYSDLYDHLAFVGYSGDIKSSFVNAFRHRIPLHGETLDDQFDGLLIDLQEIAGNKLLVMDDVKRQEEYDIIKDLSATFDLLVTSRTAFRTIHKIDVETLPIEKARELFLRYYQTEEDIDDLLEYLGHHTLFIKLTAQTLATSRLLSVASLKQKFASGAFPTIKNNDDDQKSFSEYLDELFKLNDLDERESLLLRRMALFPSIDIDFERLKDLLVIDEADLEAFDADLTTLSKTGWLIGGDKGFRLHQIVREYLLAFHPLDYSEYADIVQHFIDLLDYGPTESPLDKAEYLPFATPLADSIDVKEERVATFLNNLSSVYKAMGELPKALEYQLKDVAIREAVLGEQHPDLGSSYNNLSLVYKAMGELPKALEYQLKDVAISEAVLGEQHPDLATSYNNLSLVYNDMGALPKALEYQLKATAISEAVLGEQHPHLATSYNNLSSVYKAMGELPKALEYQLKDVAIREAVLGEQHPSLATSYNNLSSVYKAMGALPKALEYQQKTVAIFEAVLGEQHPDLATSYNNLSSVYKAMGELPKALEYQLKDVAICEAVLGEQHPSLAISYGNIARIYLATSELQKAKKYIDRAEAIFVHVFPDGHPYLDYTRQIKEDIYKAL